VHIIGKKGKADYAHQALEDVLADYSLSRLVICSVRYLFLG
jgi:hypothetical protein